MQYVYVILVRKLKGMKAENAIKDVYAALSGSLVKGVEIIKVDQEWFKQHVEDGWNIEILVKGAYLLIEKLMNIDGYRVSELLKDLQGVTTGDNKFFLFDKHRWTELENKYGLSASGLIYDCISGEDVKTWSISIRKKILFPYRKSVDKKSGKPIWEPAFMTEKGDMLDFTKAIVADEDSSEDISVRLNKRIAYGMIPPKLAGVAKYLVDNYDKLRNRTYEERRIEEYAGVWYGFHRPRTPEIIRTPSIVTPRVVKEPRFALNMHKAIPLDNVITLVPREDEKGKFRELQQKLEHVLGFNISEKEVLLYLLSILNSKISHIILKTKATKVRGGYYTIDERYLSSIIVPKPKIDDKDMLKELLSAASSANWQKAVELIIQLYSKHAKLSTEDIKFLLKLI